METGGKKDSVIDSSSGIELSIVFEVFTLKFYSTLEDCGPWVQL